MFTAVRPMPVLGIALAAAISLGLPSARAQDHHHGSAAAPPAKAQFAGDPYLLNADPVTGDSLGDKPLVYLHEGRELRFTDHKSLDTFRADPARYLPKVDQQMIQQQLPFYPLDTCMVSGDKLGGEMGKPADLIYRNRLVRFCCTTCVKDFHKDPDRFITRLNEAVTAKQGPAYPMTTCVVSGDRLGGDMGAPVDLVAGNRLVRFCCPGCVKDFSRNPARFMKMIDEAAQKKAADAKQGQSGGAAKSPDHGRHRH